MRTCRFPIILSILVLASTAAISAETFFIRTLGGPDVDRAQASATLGDLLYFAGVKDLTGLASSGLLLAATGEGDVVFERAYADPAGRPVEITALVAHGGVLHAGGTIGNWPTSGEAFVMTLSPAGDILRQLVFASDRQVFLRDLIVTRDGGLLLVGTLVPTGETIGNGWVAKLDSTGAVEWQKDVGTGGHDSVAAAVERDGGNLVLAGLVGSDRDPSGPPRGWLFELDGQGNLLWQRGYVAASGESFNSVLLERSGIVAVGTFCDWCFFRGDGWIVRTDSTGNLTRAQFIGDFNIQGFDEIIEARAVAKGQGFIVLGSTDTIIGPSQQMWAARLDNRGALRWVRQIGGAGFEMAGTMTVLPTGSIVFGGYSVTDLNQNVYVGKLDRNGRSLSGCDQVAPAAPGALREDDVLTGDFPTTASVQDASVAVASGTLTPGASPTPVDDLLCFE